MSSNGDHKPSVADLQKEDWKYWLKDSRGKSVSPEDAKGLEYLEKLVDTEIAKWKAMQNDENVHYSGDASLIGANASPPKTE